MTPVRSCDRQRAEISIPHHWGMGEMPMGRCPIARLASQKAKRNIAR